MEFAFDQENGVIIDKATGERCLTFAKPILEHIFLRLKELFQSGSHVIIAEHSVPRANGTSKRCLKKPEQT